MQMLTKNLVLIGFKHVGKTVIGQALARELQLPFVDLDDVIQTQHQQSCRQIVQMRGEVYFRQIETQALATVLAQSPAVIALGGGTPVTYENQILLRKQLLIHLMAPKKLVFDRIMRDGRPAFFADDKPAWESFDSLWLSREKIYTQLTNHVVHNHGSVDAAVTQILQQLKQISS
jgi:shikimate kinase